MEESLKYNPISSTEKPKLFADQPRSHETPVYESARKDETAALAEVRQVLY